MRPGRWGSLLSTGCSRRSLGLPDAGPEGGGGSAGQALGGILYVSGCGEEAGRRGGGVGARAVRDCRTDWGVRMEQQGGEGW